MRTFILFCLAALLLSATPPETKQIAFVNGNWFNGNGFSKETFYSVDGKLTQQQPARIDSTVNLQDKYVVPPFGEAHTHNITLHPTPLEIKPYLAAGIFYVMKQNNSFPKRDSILQDVIDIKEPGALLTPSNSHIVVINERSADNGNFPGITKNQLDGNTHVIINNKKDLSEKLGNILAQQQSFIKIVLAFSEEYEKRKADTAYIGKAGLDPALVSTIVKKAHDKGVAVSAHIETAADFRVALNSGVDIIAHLPGNRVGAAAGYSDTLVDRWLLTEADAIEAARKKVTIITTVMAGKTLLNPKKDSYRNTRSIHIHNLELLLKHNAHIVLGSDYYEGTALAEALLLGKQNLLGNGIAPLGIFDNLSLLKLWSVTTPQFIFPDRKIGELKEGYEANFLVLDGDPIQDFRYTTKISQRVKNGRFY